MFSSNPPFLPSDFMLENLSQTFNGVYTPWDSPEVFTSPETHESFVSNSSSSEPVFSSHNSDFMLENISQTLNGVYNPGGSPEVFTSPETHESFVSNSSSDAIQSPEPVFSCRTSDYPEKKTISDPEEMIFDRKQRRRISNRESAKRSRMRKQKHLEKLTIQVNRLSIEKRRLSNRFLHVMCWNQRLCNENDWFLSEYSILREKLSTLRQLLVRRQLLQSTPAWPCENLMTEQNNH